MVRVFYHSNRKLRQDKNENGRVSIENGETNKKDSHGAPEIITEVVNTSRPGQLSPILPKTKARKLKTMHPPQITQLKSKTRPAVVTKITF